MHKKGFTLIELMIVIAIIAIIASVAIPSLIKTKRSSNESAAAASMKTLNGMLATYRQGRYQGYGYKYPWGGGGPATNRGKYCGLYFELGNDGKRVSLIDNALARADCRADGDTAGNLALGSYVPVMRTTGPPQYQTAATFRLMPRVGYWFCLSRLRIDMYTYDLKQAKNHYGLMSFPSEYGQTGECTFVMNEEGEVFGFDFGLGAYRDFPKDPMNEGWKMTL
ncbi:DUF2950 family protein [Planctomycetota bacterium]